MNILIKKAVILDPESKFHTKKKDIHIRNGQIADIADRLEVKSARVIEAPQLYVSTGWVDTFSDFCDPGSEHRETLESGSEAAMAGGYTDVFLVPNTNPPLTGKAQIERIRRMSDLVRLHPMGAISKNLEGKDLAEMYDMFHAGARAFTDGHLPVQNAGLLMKALQYVKSFDGILVQLPEEKSLSAHGLMHEGNNSVRLGMAGKPDIAESILIQRDIELVDYTQSKLHISGVSTKRGIELIRQAKKRGIAITCSVHPAHLLYTDDAVSQYHSLYKITPPLRTESDRKALVKALLDGTIDVISSHHIPQDWDAKEVEFEYAGQGMISLQTMLNLLMNVPEQLTPENWIHLLTNNPRRIFNLRQEKIATGLPACLNVFSTAVSWMYTEQNNKSKSANAVLLGRELKGKVLAVINEGKYRIHE